MNTANEPLLTEGEAAEHLRLKVKTLQNFRVTGAGPKFIKLGRSVRYRMSDLQAHIEANVRRSTAEQKAAS